MSLSKIDKKFYAMLYYEFHLCFINFHVDPPTQNIWPNKIASYIRILVEQDIGIYISKELNYKAFNGLMRN